MKNIVLAKILDIIGIMIVIAFIITILPLTVPKVFGYQIYGILSNSMEPEIMTGSVVYVQGVDASDIQVGDVITYKMDAKSDVVATHRVEAINNEKSTFTTKGDNNTSVDAQPVSFDRLLGKVVFSLPLLGYISLEIQSSSGLAMIIISFAVAIFCWIFADYLKNKKQKV